MGGQQMDRVAFCALSDNGSRYMPIVTSSRYWQGAPSSVAIWLSIAVIRSESRQFFTVFLVVGSYEVQIR